jgi:hypothetical protein
MHVNGVHIDLTQAPLCVVSYPMEGDYLVFTVSSASVTHLIVGFRRNAKG